MPTIVQTSAGNPRELFFTLPLPSDTVLAESSTSFYWAREGMSGDTPVWSGGIVVEGTGFTYAGNELTVATKVTTLKAFFSLYPADYVPDRPGVTFSGLSLSAFDTMALLHGNTARLDNIIAANRWTYTGSNGDDTFTSADFADNLDGGDGADRLDGKGGNDVLQGGAGIDILYGGDGNDRIDGGLGNTDLMFGGKGDDRFYVDHNFDRVRESVGEGNDSVYATDDFKLHISAEIELLSVRDRSVAASVNLTGNDFSQTIVGGAGANQLDGEGGNDILDGGLGGDRLIGGAGTDIATYARAASAVTVSLANAALNTGEAAGDTFDAIERLIGSAFSDTLFGTNGANTIWGGNGNDTIKGYKGNDALAGGAGADKFIFNSVLNAATNVDFITDYNVAADTIQLDNAFFTVLATTGTLAASAFRANTTGLAGDATDRIVHETDTGEIYYDSNGSASGGSVLFAKVGIGLALTNADFVII